MTMLPFRDRIDAGRKLAEQLEDRRFEHDVVVLGLPRGGVPVAAEVAHALHAVLDVFVVRKLGVPGQPELAMGAIATGDVRVLNDTVIDKLRISNDIINATAAQELVELSRREREYRGDRAPAELAGRTVILVDDGLATGATMRAAVQGVRASDPADLLVAIPVGAPDSCKTVEKLADEVVCLQTPRVFGAVGAFYAAFPQTTDDEVRQLLTKYRRS